MIKPVVKVWCLPQLTEEKLRMLHRRIVAAAVTAKIGVTDENDIFCLFPPDSMQYGLGNEIVVECSRFQTPCLAAHKAARTFGATVKEIFPDAIVQSSAEVHGRNMSGVEFGFWTS